MNRFINNLPPLLRRKKSSDSDITYALIKSLEEVMIQTEDDILASKIHSFLHSAKGWSLDEWGSWFNLSRRENEGDEAYRKRIVDKIKIPRGTNAAIKWGIRDYLDDFELPINITETWTKVFINNKHMLNSDYFLIGKKFNIALFEVRILKDIKDIADRYFHGDKELAHYELLKVINSYKSSGTHATLVFGEVKETGTNESIEDTIKDEIKDKDPVLPEEEKPELEVVVRDTWENIFYTNRSNLNGEDLFIGSGTNARVIQVLISETLEDIANKYFNGNKELADATIKKIVYKTKPENTIPYITYGATVITGKEFTDLQTDVRELTKLEDLIITMTETREKVFFTNESSLTGNAYLVGKKYNEGIKEFLINKTLQEIADKRYKGNINKAHIDIKRLIYKYYPDKKVPYIVYGVHDLTDEGSDIDSNKPIEKPNVTLSKEELEKLTETELEKLLVENVKITIGKEISENIGKEVGEYKTIDLEELNIRNTWEDVSILNNTKLNGTNKFVGSKNNAGVVEVNINTHYDFLGEVKGTEFIEGEELAKELDLTAGDKTTEETNWLKFVHKGKILYVAKTNFRTRLSWEELYESNVVYGNKTINIDGVTYKVRLLRGIGEDVQPDPKKYQPKFKNEACYNSEWNLLMCPISDKAPDKWLNSFNVASPTKKLRLNYSDNELGAGRVRSWCMEVCGRDELTRSTRGGSLTFAGYGTKAYKDSTFGWRPVLELVDDSFLSIVDKMYKDNKELAEAVIEREIYRESPKGISINVNINK